MLTKRWFNWKKSTRKKAYRVLLFLAFVTLTLKFLLTNLGGDVESLDNVHAAVGNVIYIVTPTYSRHVQKAELTRLSYALMHLKNIFWIVVEDALHTSPLVAGVLARSGIKHQLLFAETPKKFKLKDPTAAANWKYPRGVAQRNAALNWLRKKLPKHSTGVLYFADDDNTYDLRIFDEMRSTKRVSVWPVAFVGEVLVESPIVTDGKVTGFRVAYGKKRPFPLDMAGFAVNVQLVLQNSNSYFNYLVPIGYQESHFLQPLVSIDELEPKASNCTQVLVWHTRTTKPFIRMEKFMNENISIHFEV